MVNFDPKRFAEGETLMVGVIHLPRPDKRNRVPAALALREIDHALAGQNLFRISVREKGPAIRQ